jgi:ribosomal protein S18 acetylase RimI-like enzyme
MIYNADPVDGDQIYTITSRCGMFNAEEVQCVAEIWQQCMQLGVDASGYNFFVEKENDRVLGFVCVGPRALTDRVHDLYWIVVDSEVQRNGVGRRLIEKAEQFVRERNGRILVIETSGTKKYHGTRAFYKACGYLHEATLRDLYAEDDDLCIFTKRIK